MFLTINHIDVDEIEKSPSHNSVNDNIEAHVQNPVNNNAEPINTLFEKWTIYVKTNTNHCTLFIGFLSLLILVIVTSGVGLAFLYSQNNSQKNYQNNNCSSNTTLNSRRGATVGQRGADATTLVIESDSSIALKVLLIVLIVIGTLFLSVIGAQ